MKSALSACIVLNSLKQLLGPKGYSLNAGLMSRYLLDSGGLSCLVDTGSDIH